MIMSLLPMQLPVKAETTPSINLESPSQITTPAAIYFGQYTKDDDSKAPILWRVMRVEEGKATLLSDEILEYNQFDNRSYDNWSGSDICEYLNNADTGFLGTAFTTAEQEYITPYSEVDEQGFAGNTFKPNQKIVLPSVDEVKDDGAFGFKDNDSRKADNAVGCKVTGKNVYDGDWWLRSPCAELFYAATVVSDGGVFGGPRALGSSVPDSLGVRPALKLDLSSVLFTSDAQGEGKNSETPNSQLASVESSSNNQKLTCIDSYDETNNPLGQNLSIDKKAFKYIKGQETEIEISYSEATTGENQYLSAMITDTSGVLKYYGVIKALPEGSPTEGTAKVTIPSNFESNWELKIFAEQINSDSSTDYASEPVLLELTEATDLLPEVAKGDTLYFGRYTKDDDSKAPILWRVMEKDLLSDTITLLSDEILEYRPYHSSFNTYWSGSDICSYLNSEFLSTAFTLQEQGYITPYSSVEEEIKIVLPSVNEVQNGGAFGFNNDASRMADNAEGYKGNATSNEIWWLRFPDDYDIYLAYVDSDGCVNLLVYFVNNSLGVRPALKLDLSSVLFTSVTDIKVPEEIGGITHAVSSDALKAELKEKVKAKINNEEIYYTVEWDVEKSTYDATDNKTQTFDVKGKILPEGVVKLASGMSLDTKISVTVDVAKYSITYNLNEGTQGANAPSGYTYGEGTILPIPSKTEHSFEGWYTNEDCTGDSVETIEITDTGDKIYWAKWERTPIAPIITTTSLPNGTVGTSYSQTLTATGDTPIKWSVDSGTLPVGLSLNSSTGEISGTPTAVGNASFTIKASNDVEPAATRALSITVDAVPVITYTVSFDSNGGNTINSITDIPSYTTITLETPIRANYRFEGWYEGNVQYTSSTPITKSVTLVAKWSYIGTSSGGNSGSNSGGNSGGSTTSTAQKTTKERIASLSSSQKQAVANYFKEELPYTTMNPSFVEEALKRLTDKHFTDAQVKEILGDKALLKELGIESHRTISQITLKPITHATFTDVATNHWAYEAIKEAAALGLVAGMPDGSFAPNSPLQVADTFTFLDRVLILNNINGMKLPRSTVEKYLTNKEHWAFASMASIASKLSEATLKTISELGDKPLSRELLTQVLYEVTDGKLEPIKESIAFEDTANSPYKEAIDYCVRAGLISGVNRTHMAPTKSVTRAELMKVLIRLDNILK